MTGHTDRVAGSNKRDILRTLDVLRQGQGLIGYPWPWEYLNERTVGLCSGNVFYFYGRQKSKKTWLLLWMALFYWSRGMRVLFFTREMTRDELDWRLIALICGFDFLSLVKGEITTEGQVLLEQKMDELHQSNRFIISEVDGGVSEFKAKIEEVRPNIVFHDFFKAMADSDAGAKMDEHRSVARTVDKIKDYAISKAHIPLILAGHANREGAKTKGMSDTEHAWSDNITRKTDAAFRVINDKANDRIAIVVNSGRAIQENVSFTISGRLCHGFGEMLEEGAPWLSSLLEREDGEDKNRSQSQTPKGDGHSKFSGTSFKKPFKRR